MTVFHDIEFLSAKVHDWASEKPRFFSHKKMKKDKTKSDLKSTHKIDTLRMQKQCLSHCLFVYRSTTNNLSCFPNLQSTFPGSPCNNPTTQHRTYHRYRLSFQSQFFFLWHQYIICPEEFKHWLSFSLVSY